MDDEPRLADAMLSAPRRGGVQEETFAVIDELDIVAALKPAEKLGLNPPRIVGAGLAAWLQRQYESWFAQGGREATLAYLGKLFDRAFAQLAVLAAPERATFGGEGAKLRSRLAASLRKSITSAETRGLPSLRATYSDDATMTSRLDSLAERVRLRLESTAE